MRVVGHGRALVQALRPVNRATAARADLARALRCLHAAAGEGAPRNVAVGVIGSGGVGGELLDQIHQFNKVSKDNVTFQVRAIAGSKQMLLNDAGIALEHRQKGLTEMDHTSKLTETCFPSLASFLKEGSSKAIIIDCTASGEVASEYVNWLKQGISVVTPNKKAGSFETSAYDQLRLAASGETEWKYEASVGAGLPLISTLEDILKTGDKVHRIEGILSGTLSYIFNSMTPGRKFSEVVQDAKVNGFTEPDPRDDLSGTDVQRKCLILARECGLELNLEDIPVQSLVPEPLLNWEPPAGQNLADAFIEALKPYDGEMDARMAAAEGGVLRYVGVVDVQAKSARVELKRYDGDHAFAGTKHADNIVLFATERYQPQPLVVQGPGAGGPVTAHGVFADLLHIGLASKVTSKSIAVGIVGSGVVGGELLDQINHFNKTSKDVTFQVRAIAGSKQMLLNEGGVALDNRKKGLTEMDPASQLTDVSFSSFASLLQQGSSKAIIVDCTASGDVASEYVNWLEQGISVVTPNKKAGSFETSEYNKLREAPTGGAEWKYEATVGAGLPLISTLEDLLKTGDKVHRIEGVLSGTLSYIFNSMTPGRKFSEVVEDAKVSGFTEPDPRDDLSGTDVQRKCLILARECGLELNLEDIPVQSLVPEPLLNWEPPAGQNLADAFIEALKPYDGEMDAKMAAAEGGVLRYVGVVDVQAKSARVELKKYDSDHAFAGTKHADNIVLFSTERYQPQPLVIQGPGAGAAVTAHGIFADVLHASRVLS